MAASRRRGAHEDETFDEPPYENYENNEKSGADVEDGAPPSTVGYKGKADPFGDESNAEVKYRTMEWW